MGMITILAFVIPLMFQGMFNEQGTIRVYADPEYAGYMWNACEEWNSAVNVFEPTPDETSADVVISSGYERIGAYAFATTDGRILINEDEWKKASHDQKVQIVIHEMGHEAGLHHSEGKNDDDSVMYKVVFGRKIAKRDKEIFKKYYKKRFGNKMYKKRTRKKAKKCKKRKR